MNPATIIEILNNKKEELQTLVGKPISFIVQPLLEDKAYIKTEISVKDSCIEPVAHFYMVRMPGNCGMVITTGVTVYNPFRNKGIGKLLSKIREIAAFQDGYTLLLETGTTQDTPQELGLLKKSGFKEIERFVNKRTGNTVCVMAKNLREQPI